MKKQTRGGSFSTNAMINASGTETPHIAIVSRINPNFESPPALKIPQIKTVLIDAPKRERALI